MDRCSDDSVALVELFSEQSDLRVRIATINSDSANVGRARARAMDLGLEALGGRDGLLLTTDADSCPAQDWVAAMASALEEADVVAGRIVRRCGSPSPLQDRLEAYYDALFALRRRLDPVPWEAHATHHHSGGANLGIRSGVYRRLGGFAAVASGEDARLVDEASRAGFRVRRDAACVVETSDRRDGRCPGGLAHALRAHDAPGAADPIVAHPRDAAWQYREHARARAAFAAGQPWQIAAALGLTADHAIGVARDCQGAEAFAMRIVPVPPAGMRHVPLPVAEAELAALSLARAAA